MDYKVGQRWVSHAEAQLGLGIVVDIDGRRVTLAFPAVEEERTYAMDNAPLTRIRFNVGEMLHVVDGQALEVTAVSEQAGLLVYTAEDADGNRHQVPELRLSSQLILTTPPQRLFSGQFDRNSAFALRVASLTHRARLQQSQVQGLLGARTSLLPHQIHIAAEVAGRHAPRVLLADEVGLGKTIEAGMILHAQLHSGRARRVLILVPDSLLHQWLVEMLRRFNLSFALFDAQRFDAQRETDPEANPFDTEQRVLCSLSQLVARDDMHAAALAAGWDLMVVDEAHHLHWSETAASPAYLAVEALARKTHGLLLLTATPEQVGVESHFARLRLLDPARFHDLAAFRAEEAAWQPLNTLVQRILEGEGPLEPALEADLQPWLGDDLTQAGHDRARIIRQLLDRHGTGRVLFRNTRAAIKGFPARQLHRYGLPAPDLYAGQQALFPEQMHASEAWLAADPRVVWLEKRLIALRPHKVLVICAHASTALALESHLQLRAGIRSAAFHEGLTLIERDRAAAWFADTEQGAQALVCSEIGSEGRNFQFAHHLVLFDLPRNPDLLEQRIGRLDRIGQTDTIEIHVPYLEDSPQAVLQRWFHDGLNAFEQSCAVGMAVDEAVGEALDQQLASPDNGLEALIERTRTLAEQARQALQTGRDPLLELNSCDRP
ncbi:MAG: RNA polymerase-associated protein RapA, partial [Gammaproteobacteria bacterium]|nr:RNA polymerase-associated protein RapA [Gammaproteobacteria bacterium]